jgi:CHAT domain-containing protein/tetratricopeptide (TPR) repeat protein
MRVSLLALPILIWFIATHWHDSHSMLLAEDSVALKKYEQAIAGIMAVEKSNRTPAEKVDLKQRWYAFAASGISQQLTQAMQAQKLSQALAWSEKACGLAQVSLPAGHAKRCEQLLLRAQLKFHEYLSSEKPDAKSTLELLEKSAAESTTGNQPAFLLEALNRISLIKVKTDPSDVSGFARLLILAEKTQLDAPPVQSESLRFVWSTLWLPTYQAAGEQQVRQSVDPAARDLKTKLDQLKTKLVKAQVPEALAGAGHLFLARFHVDTLNLDAADEELGRLTKQIDAAKMPPFWRVQLHIVKGRRASNLALFSESRLEFENALQIADAAKLPDLSAVIRVNLGELLLRQGDYNAAESYLRDAVDAYEDVRELQTDAQRPIALVSLAKTYEAGGKFSKAVRLYQEAIGLTESAEKPNPLTLALCRNNLAACEYMAGNFDSAGKLFGQVQTSFKTLFGDEHLRVAELKSNLAWLELESGRKAAANKLFGESLAMAQVVVGDTHPRTAEIMSYLARTEFLSGRIEKAAVLLREALLQREQHLRRTLKSALSERDRLAIIQELRVHPESAAWPGVFDTWLDLAPAMNVSVEEQYAGVLAWKGSLERYQFDAIGSGAATGLVAQRQKVLGQLRSIYYAGSARMSRRERRAKIESLETEANRLEREIATATGVAIQQPVTLERLKASLPPRTVFLDVIQIRHHVSRSAGEEVAEKRSYLGFLIRPDGPITRVDFGDVASFNKSAIEFFKSVSAGNDDYRIAGQILAEKIRTPLLPLTDIQCLFVCGDGLFHLLPLGALPGSSADSFWIDELAFVSVGSAHSFVDTASRKYKVEPLTGLVIGGLDYGTPAEGQAKWLRLPGTLREAKSIAKRMGDRVKSTSLLTENQPTESAVSQLLKTSHVVHLATHGFFGGNATRQTDGFEVLTLTQEMDSAVVLAQANSPMGSDDGLITAAEVGEMNLRHVRLMVLSACQTGLGHIRAGQGLVGLLGALSRSGVRSTISALWAVNDEATAGLMVELYAGMQQDQSPLSLALALRAAQLKLRNGVVKPASGGFFKHPRFWSAFFLSGSPRGF